LAFRRLEIATVALVGSHARGEARPDSDVDLVLVCADPDEALFDRSWMVGFGERTEEEIPPPDGG